MDANERDFGISLRWIRVHWRLLAVLFYDFSAEGEDAGVCLRGLGVGDVSEADVNLGESRPGEEVVGLEGGCLERGSEGIFELIGF